MAAPHVPVSERHAGGSLEVPGAAGPFAGYWAEMYTHEALSVDVGDGEPVVVWSVWRFVDEGPQLVCDLERGTSRLEVLGIVAGLAVARRLVEVKSPDDSKFGKAYGEVWRALMRQHGESWSVHPDDGSGSARHDDDTGEPA